MLLDESRRLVELTRLHLSMGLLEYNDNLDASVPFDYPEFDQPEPDEASEVTLSPELLAAALRPVVEWLLKGQGVHRCARLMVLATHLGVRIDDEIDSYSDISRHLGVSRQSVNWIGKRIEEQWGLRYIGGRTDATRQRSAHAAIKAHAARRNA